VDISALTLNFKMPPWQEAVTTITGKNDLPIFSFILLAQLYIFQSKCYTVIPAGVDISTPSLISKTPP
jgi:hypothetical protein